MAKGFHLQTPKEERIKMQGKLRERKIEKEKQI